MLQCASERKEIFVKKAILCGAFVGGITLFSILFLADKSILTIATGTFASAVLGALFLGWYCSIADDDDEDDGF